ncbi:MAG: cob(I)yrinic acid a,c-diamide adenosyltransferase [Thermodesulfovibrio sp.]|nr:cob(I)yrinic acid a,c-diamide adenosyltransferase [Thermodesulfovibrio sp.]
MKVASSNLVARSSSFIVLPFFVIASESLTRGLVHIYTGDGKGKTTAAVGISVRARGSGLSVLFAQFFKEKTGHGEVPLMQSIGIDTLVFDSVKSPLFNPDIDKKFLTSEVTRALTEITGYIRKKHYDLLVLDEFICLMTENVLSETDAIIFLENKPENIELVLTGNGARESFIEHADYVTFMKNIKHPFASHTDARRGIEF